MGEEGAARLFAVERQSDHRRGEPGRRDGSLLPPLSRIVVAVDPPASTGEDADECGIIVADLGEDGHGYVLADCSSKGDAPIVWAKKVLRAYALWNANQIIVEVNQGGAMVRSTLEQANAQYDKLWALPIVEVHAKHRQAWHAPSRCPRSMNKGVCITSAISASLRIRCAISRSISIPRLRAIHLIGSTPWSTPCMR